LTRQPCSRGSRSVRRGSRARRASWRAPTRRLTHRLEGLLVLTRGAPPAAIEAHDAATGRPPARRLGRPEPALRGAREALCGGVVEEEAGSRLELCVAIDDRIDQTARGARDRQRSIALSVELHETARLEPTRHEHEVGRCEHAVDDALRRRTHEMRATVALLA